MTPAQALATYRRLMGRGGEAVTFQRLASGGGSVAYSATVLARVLGYSGQNVGETDLGGRRLIVIHADLVDAGFPTPPTTQDRVTVRGVTVHVENVDGDTRRVQGVCIGYDVLLAGGPSTS